MFEMVGFFGTRASMFLDIVGVYFLALPLLMMLSIRLAVKKKFVAHIRSQIALFVASVLMIVLFEVGVRLAGGFRYYLQFSGVNTSFFIIFLVIHIIVAVVTVLLWIYQVVDAMKRYKAGILDVKSKQRHAKRGKYLVGLLMLLIVQGAVIYGMLFMM